MPIGNQHRPVSTMTTDSNGNWWNGVILVDGDGVPAGNTPPVGAENFVGGQAAVTDASAVEVVASRVGRVSVVVHNIGTDEVYLGDATVTASTGLPLLAGESLPLPTQAAIYAICNTSETATVGYAEVY